MTAEEIKALPVGAEVVVKKSGKVYRVTYKTERPAHDIASGLNDEYYASGRGVSFRQVREGKLYGPISHLKAENVTPNSVNVL